MGIADNRFVERRRFPRYPCKGAAEVLIVQSGKSRRWGTVKDISRVGCYIETMHPLPIGAEAQLRFTLAGIFLDIGAKVVSSSPMCGMGMDFMVVAPEQWNKLPQIMAKVADVDLAPAVQHNEASPEVAQPHTQAALQHLEQAQKELQEAIHGQEGYQAEALYLAENTINEVKNACKRGSTIETTGPVSMGTRVGSRFEVL